MRDIKEINKTIEELFMLLGNSYESPAKANISMQEGLAHMYADVGFRSYLENSINLAIKSSALRAEDEKDFMFMKGRILTLSQILSQAKDSYLTFERIKKARLEDRQI